MTILALGAIFMLVVGHILRAVRQATLFPANARPGNFHLMVGLGLGHVINALVPFRLGEMVRAFYVSQRAKQSFGLVCATVLAERVWDLIVVAAILAAVALSSQQMNVLSSAVLMMMGAISAFITSALLIHSQGARTVLWSATSLFNERVRMALIDMVWTAAQLLTSTAMLRPRFLLLTVLMWAAYLIAYAMLGRAIGLDFHSITTILLSAPLNALLVSGLPASAVVVMASLATLMILGAGLIADGVGVRDAIRSALHLGLSRKELPAFAFSGASFARTEDYGAMLDAHFTRRRPTMASFGLHGTEGAVVRHLLPGGSDAVTAVVAIGDRLAIRKFGTDDAGRKLADQVSWLRRYRAQLPLADVEKDSSAISKFYYDMPYISSARDLYEMAHVMPLAESQNLLGDVVDRVACWHGETAGLDCSDQVMRSFIDGKIIANAHSMLHFARTKLSQRHFINGTGYELDDWQCVLDPNWIVAQMPTRKTSAIHGDLTIENIVVCTERSPGWYLIDPNQGNIFNTPLIDWSKLMQSLNLGYEALNRGPIARIDGRNIDVMFSRSRIYAELHAALRLHLAERLGIGTMREIAFHEIVNYLRLMPYKIRQNPAKAMTFFAAASILLRRYREDRDD